MPRASHRPASLLLALTLAACATSPASVGSGTTRALPVGATGGSRSGVGLEVTARTDGHVTSLNAAPDPVFVAVTQAYEALEIPMTKRDAASRTVANDGLRMRRQLGRVELRRAFDCGGTAGMPNSETYQITASFTTVVTPGDGGNTAVVTTAVDASAVNASFGGSAVRCSSNGTFEEAIAKYVRTRLALGT
jgi:hypothetical protein